MKYYWYDQVGKKAELIEFIQGYIISYIRRLYKVILYLILGKKSELIEVI